MKASPNGGLTRSRRRRSWPAPVGSSAGISFVTSCVGAPVRAVDVKPLDDWHQVDSCAENVSLDLRRIEACRDAVHGMGTVYNLAADMGGNTLIRNVFGWEPSIRLEDGLEKTYRWIFDRLSAPLVQIS